MADLSFIEDSVAFPEKEEDEEEEEGVEWGYEEGNPQRAGWPGSRDSASEATRGVCPAQRRALHAADLARSEHRRVPAFPRGSLSLSQSPGRFRDRRSSRDGGRACCLLQRWGAGLSCPAAVGTCLPPEGKPESCGGDISVF